MNSVSNSHGSSTRQHLNAYGIHCDGKISDSEGSAWGSGIRARGNAGVVTNSSGSSTHGHGIDANQVSASSGYASATGLHGIFAELVTHSRGARASDDGVNAGIHALRGVGSLAIKGEIITEKFDMP